MRPPAPRITLGGMSVRLVENGGMDAQAKSELLDRPVAWRDEDEPLVEAIGETLAQVHRLDSQEQARWLVKTVIDVLEREL
jgi:hypothetical protein